LSVLLLLYYFSFLDYYIISLTVSLRKATSTISKTIELTDESLVLSSVLISEH
jgi:hypothetical protein